MEYSQESSGWDTVSGAVSEIQSGEQWVEYSQESSGWNTVSRAQDGIQSGEQ